jgi:hypothetical protein
VRRWRRPLALLTIGLVACAVLAAPASVGPVQAEDAPFVLGSGAASATVTKARIFYAGFSLQVPLGLSATTYENRQSRALGSAYDLTSVTGLVDGADQPQLSPVSIDSNKGDASKTVDAGAGAVVGHIALSARTVPASQAEVRLADVDLPGLVRIEGGHSKAITEVVGGKERRATAAVTIGTMSLAGGLVVLDGLRWEATQRSGAAKQADATFTLGSVRIGGVPIATDLHDLVPVLKSINDALAPVGLVIEAPEVLHRDNGAVDMTAIRIGIINSPLGAQLLGPILAGVRPLLLPAFDALTQANSSLGLAGLLTDLGLGVADGSGGLDLAFGGATARTDDAQFADPLAVVPPALPPTAVPSTPSPTPTFGGLPAPLSPVVPTPGSTQLLPASAGGPARCVLVASPRRQGTCRGTNVAGAVGIVALVGAGMSVWEAAARRRRSRLAAAGATR